MAVGHLRSPCTPTSIYDVVVQYIKCGAAVSSSGCLLPPGDVKLPATPRRIGGGSGCRPKTDGISPGHPRGERRLASACPRAGVIRPGRSARRRTWRVAPLRATSLRALPPSSSPPRHPTRNALRTPNPIPHHRSYTEIPNHRAEPLSASRGGIWERSLGVTSWQPMRSQWDVPGGLHRRPLVVAISFRQVFDGMLLPCTLAELHRLVCEIQ